MRMRRAGERGYTSLEIIIVSALAGILLAFGANNVRLALGREELNGRVRGLIYEITAAQQAAITRRTMVTATFQDQTYTIAVLGGGVLRHETLPSHITFGTEAQTFSFDRRGAPTSAYNLAVSSTRTGQTYTITIEAGTGRASFGEP